MYRSESSGWHRSGVLLSGDGDAGDVIRQECSKMHAITSPWRQCSNGEPSSRILCGGGCQAVEAFVSLLVKVNWKNLKGVPPVCVVCWLFIFKDTEPS